uniref:C2H2-type domain-containing protein n=1 Tax=Myotis myotis TaxID=51298 RepID=A0A7J7VYW3_MYOMY|nr:hypothetical protein mMyoMyo1_012239 [Myotis myotis]
MGTQYVWKSLYSSHNMHIKCQTEYKPYEYQNYREKPYICSICGRAFSYLQCFEKHKRNHTRAKTYQCKEYGKILSSSTSLQIHERTHTEEKLYQCKQYGKVYTRYHQTFPTHHSNRRETP